MRRLRSIENEQVQLEVIECDCGYHMGIDATYLDQVEDVFLTCPACTKRFRTDEICPEDGKGVLDECNEVCAQHDPDCDGFCDHLEGHMNACLVQT